MGFFWDLVQQMARTSIATARLGDPSVYNPHWSLRSLKG